MSFEVTFLGTCGGPLETGNCSTLIKPANVSYSEIIHSGRQCLLAIDAGSGHAALSELILDSHSIPRRQLAMYADSMPVQEYSSVPVTWPFAEVRAHAPTLSLLRLSHAVFRSLSTVLVSHPHLDHISALVLNSPLLSAHVPGRRIRVVGLAFTIDALQKYIFNGIIWPDLPSLQLFDLERVQPLRPLSVADDCYSVTTFEVTHGHISAGGLNAGSYTSSAFLVTDNASQNKLLVFGDCESGTPSSVQKNACVWRHVAPFVDDCSLKCIVLECSTSNVEPSTDLYGHLTPAHVIHELQTLASLCACTGRPPLDGLHIIITHVKDVVTGGDPRRKVLSELRDLCDQNGLGLRFSVALNGVSMVI